MSMPPQQEDTHDHDHIHSHTPSSYKVLVLALTLTLGYAVVEAVGGWFSGSLALLGDAGHMFSDGLSLGLAAFTAWLATRQASLRHSYGLGKAELLAALFNALFMLGIIVWITVGAVSRLLHPIPVNGEAVTLVAGIGLLINLLVAWLLARSGSNINIKAALLHVIGDLLGSVAALISGFVIMLTGWMPIDPILSLLIVLLILGSSLRLLRMGLHLLLDGVPQDISLSDVGQSLAAIEHVVAVHDLHIWSLSADRQAITAHLVVDYLERWPKVLAQAQQVLQQDYAIDHVTLQPEFSIVQEGLLQISEPGSS